MFNQDFYPTPDFLTERLLFGIDLKRNLQVLEPSAGKGDMALYLQERFKGSNRFDHYSLKVDCIEIEDELQAILRGKELKVVHDDFLTFECTKAYDLILANFPFSKGEKHLLKAISILEKFGGELRCIVSASTLKNPCTFLRDEIREKLNRYNAEISFVEDAFTEAERKTGVEVALITVKLAAVEYESLILDSLEKNSHGYDGTDEEYRELMTAGNSVDKEVQFYKNEVESGIRLIREYFALKGRYGIAIQMMGNGDTDKEAVNQFIEMTRDKYWRKLINTDAFFTKMPQNMRTSLLKDMEELCHYDFNFFNIVQIQDILQRNLAQSVSDTILMLFDKLSHTYAYGDGLQNRLHYNGWKTNEAYKVNTKKVIIPHMRAYGDYSFNKDKFDLGYSNRDTLSDIHKTLRFLDTGLSESFDLDSFLKDRQEPKNIDCQYFVLDFFKKGTCHIKWKRPDLIEKLNIYGSQKKGWLPPTYGNKAYKDMNPEEKSVVDSFQGEADYNKVCLEKSKYFVLNPLALAGEISENIA